ncbi:hypothetical protein GLU60_00660 [Nanohaloarchaea archaeon H01]|nr:hypothetical protein [Nanohaloarchaea archaeon H01]
MEKDVDFDRVEYATNRELENDDGEKTGHIKMFSYDNELFFYELTCPYCGHEFEDEGELGSRPWWIECPECTRSTNVFRIKDAHDRKVKDRGADTDEAPDVDV